MNITLSFKGKSDLSDSYYRIWTLQPLEVWEKLKSDGCLYVEPARCGDIFHSNQKAYDWLLKQLKFHIPSYKGYYPWWGWYSPKPDLRKFRHYSNKNEHYVRILLSVPSVEVMLLDFMSWHMVLNNWYIPIDQEDDIMWQQFEKTLNFDKAVFPLNERYNSLIQKSWENVFNIERLRKGGIWSTKVIQGVFEELNLKNVISVDSFIGTYAFEK